ncbi:Bet1-like protein [Drosera capensis]
MAKRVGAVAYRLSDGLSTRQVTGTDEIQLRIDPMQGDLDDEITGLRNKVRLLRDTSTAWCGCTSEETLEGDARFFVFLDIGFLFFGITSAITFPQPGQHLQYTQRILWLGN